MWCIKWYIVHLLELKEGKHLSFSSQADNRRIWYSGDEHRKKRIMKYLSYQQIKGTKRSREFLSAKIN